MLRGNDDRGLRAPYPNSPFHTCEVCSWRFGDYLRVPRLRWRPVAYGRLLAVAVAVGLTLAVTPTYRAQRNCS